MGVGSIQSKNGSGKFVPLKLASVWTSTQICKKNLRKGRKCERAVINTVVFCCVNGFSNSSSVQAAHTLNPALNYKFNLMGLIIYNRQRKTKW